MNRYGCNCCLCCCENNKKDWGFEKNFSKCCCHEQKKQNKCGYEHECYEKQENNCDCGCYNKFNKENYYYGDNNYGYNQNNFGW